MGIETQNNTQTIAGTKKVDNTIWGTGRRKTATARVRFVPSKPGGKFLVNNLALVDFFKGDGRHQLLASQAIKAVQGFGGYDIFIRVSGGGITGQAEAIRHGTARILASLDPTYKALMRKEGFLTRDPRAVERKKSGQPKARKRFQYSKR